MSKKIKTKRPRKTAQDREAIQRRKFLRRQKMQAQDGLCYYCGQPMWEDDPTAFCSTYGVPARRAARFRCTAEHLCPRSEGGLDCEDNIVAVHEFCNWARHHRFEKPSDPHAYTAHVRESLVAGIWPCLPYAASAGRNVSSTAMRSEPAAPDSPLLHAIFLT
jgi:5-methylcytosine-specific restriction endonuclease McrA